MVGHTMQIKALFIIQSFVAVLLIVGYKTQITVFVVSDCDWSRGVSRAIILC